MTEAPDPAPPENARHLLRRCDRATLATAFAGSGWPYASLVLVTTDFDASPLLLISALAEHTKNLAAEPRASLLFDDTLGLDDPLTGARVTVLGELHPDGDPTRLGRFIARHPAAAVYAGFADFKLYRMAVARAHLVAGFGRIHWIDGAQLLDHRDVAWLREGERGILQHMNEDHAEMLDLYAQRLLGREGSGWRLTGVDAEGADLRRGAAVARVTFPAPATGLDAVRQNFVALAQSARRGALSQ